MPHAVSFLKATNSVANIYWYVQSENPETYEIAYCCLDLLLQHAYIIVHYRLFVVLHCCFSATMLSSCSKLTSKVSISASVYQQFIARKNCLTYNVHQLEFEKTYTVYRSKSILYRSRNLSQQFSFTQYYPIMHNNAIREKMSKQLWALRHGS